MTAEAPDELVEVDTMHFPELMREGTPLALDDYQRPYVWEPDQVEQLAADLKEHAEQVDANRDYYMGALLLHEDRQQNKCFIIDGQQRLTSLCILHHRLHGTLPSRQALAFRSPESARRIAQARDRLDHIELGANPARLLDRVCFTVIAVRNADLAFTFFDTQNNRGVRLAATDLLKAHHLRALAGSEGSLLQDSCARRWERLQRRDGAGGRRADFAPTLFREYLWRGRRWVGQRDLKQGSHERVLSEFQQATILAPNPSSVAIYGHALAAGCAQPVASLALDAQDACTLSSARERSLCSPADYPFLIRQPISRGLGFFLYAEKYAHLMGLLFHEKPVEREVNAFRTLIQVHDRADLSQYLRSLFRLAALMYVDRFGTDGLFLFSLWLDHVLGAIRLEKKYIFEAAPVRFLIERKLNLLDVLAAAFRPAEVVEYLRADQEANAIYSGENLEGRGVQGRYKTELLKFYERTGGSLRDKQKWITDTFVKGRLECAPSPA